VKVRRGGEAVDLGPTDARDWTTTEAEVCANGHPLAHVGVYKRADGRNPECLACRREAVARFRSRVRVIEGSGAAM
jgi:hypothetical protein